MGQSLSSLLLLNGTNPSHYLHRFSDNNAASQQDASLTAALRDLYKDMGKTSEGFPPLLFLQVWPLEFSNLSFAW